MQVHWKFWMLWLDKKTGRLRPGAPPSARRRYEEYKAQRRRFQRGLIDDPPDWSAGTPQDSSEP